MKDVLLLTSSIEPQYLDLVSRADLHLRAQDYGIALDRWLKSGWFEKIVFCDNSGFTTKKIIALLREGSCSNRDWKDVEFLSFRDQADRRFHYGYSELGIIDYAFMNSSVLADCRRFVKCTGRLFVPGYGRLMPRLRDDLQFHVDARSDFLWLKNKQVTTQLMVFGKQFYASALLHARSKMTEDQYFIEHFLYDTLIAYVGRRGCYYRWPMELVPTGIGAHSSRSYSSYPRRAISAIRGLGRQIVPDLWL